MHTGAGSSGSPARQPVPHTADDSTELETRVDHILSAQREDGISLGYAVGKYAGIIINSGCVPVSEPGEIDYIPPVGGIEPGSGQDNVDRYLPDSIPTDQAAAVDPLAGTHSAVRRPLEPSPRFGGSFTPSPRNP